VEENTGDGLASIDHPAPSGNAGNGIEVIEKRHEHAGAFASTPSGDQSSVTILWAQLLACTGSNGDRLKGLVCHVVQHDRVAFT